MYDLLPIFPRSRQIVKKVKLFEIVSMCYCALPPLLPDSNTSPHQKADGNLAEHRPAIRLMHFSSKQKHRELLSCAPFSVRSAAPGPDLEEKQACRWTVDSGPRPTTKCNMAEFSKHTSADTGLLNIHFIHAA